MSKTRKFFSEIKKLNYHLQTVCVDCSIYVLQWKIGVVELSEKLKELKCNEEQLAIFTFEIFKGFVVKYFEWEKGGIFLKAFFFCNEKLFN